MKKQSHDTVLGVNACKDNILQWTTEIQDLQIKIVELELKIANEKTKQEYLESKTAEISQEEINKEARDGIEHFSSAKVMDEAII
ncbi:hypothetical protein A2U01_0046333 [Trifolium medium]|uniref:Uncharacterized protein n=1 Tax=Trifolium medium TaxID=97028 RepID=A0A392QMP8_9FABA|nr:hypothetical protein [Trifolium medium]